MKPEMVDTKKEDTPILNSNEGYGSDDLGDSKSVKAPVKSPGAFSVILTLLSALGGFLYGYDVGVMSGALILIREVFQLSKVHQELVISITIAAAALFSLLAGVLSKTFGHRPVIMFASFAFMIGALVQGCAMNAATIAGGRYIVGIGIGIVSTTVPVYIAECAPTDTRGIMVVVNYLCMAAGHLLSALSGGAFSYDRLNGWRYMLGLSGVPATVQFIGFWFLPESPRWLVISGRMASAEEALRRIRGHADIEDELELIRRSCVEDRADLESKGFGSSPLIVQIFSSGHVRRALFVGCGLHIIQQTIAINTISYYTATIIESAGVQNTSSILWISAGVISTSFIVSFLAVALVEKIGRRKLTLGSLTGVLLSLIVIAVGFQLQANFSDSVIAPPSSISSCSQYRSCYDCIQASQCGFCQAGALMSSCEPQSNVTNNQEEGAKFGPCTAESLTANPSYTWIKSFCPSQYSWIPVIGLVLYFMCYVSGMGPMPWTINSEIYPLWARSTAVSIATTTHWVCNITMSMTFLSMMDAMTPYGLSPEYSGKGKSIIIPVGALSTFVARTPTGVFWMYASCACVGLLFLYFLLPETKGRTLEEVEDLFMQPWC